VQTSTAYSQFGLRFEIAIIQVLEYHQIDRAKSFLINAENVEAKVFHWGVEKSERG